jgi:hypothetical protein
VVDERGELRERERDLRRQLKARVSDPAFSGEVCEDMYAMGRVLGEGSFAKVGVGAGRACVGRAGPV